MHSPIRLVLGLCLLMVTGQGAYAQSELEGFVDSVVSSQIEKRKIAGAVVTVVRDGAVVFSKGYGAADVATRRPMTSATLVRIGSITKTFTALAVMQLVEAGKLGRHADAASRLACRSAGATRRR